MKRIIFSLVVLLIPTLAISQKSKPIYFKADFIQVYDINNDKKLSYDLLNHVYFGRFISENTVVGITSNKSVSTNDDNRYMPQYTLSDYQFFSVHFFKLNRSKIKPFLSFKRPFKFKNETYYVYNDNGDLSIEEQPFGLIDQISLGVGCSFTISKNLFFDISYSQLLKKNIYGFKNGFTSFGIHFELYN